MKRHLWLLLAFVVLLGISIGVGFFVGLTRFQTTAETDASLISKVSKDAQNPPDAVEQSFAQSLSLQSAQPSFNRSERPSRRQMNMPYEEYIRLRARSRKLGKPTAGEQPATVENFSFLALDKSVSREVPEVSERLKVLVREALAQNFLVEAKPFLVVFDIAKGKIDIGKVNIVLPVVATEKPAHPLILQEASLGKVVVGKEVFCAKLEEMTGEVTAALELAKKLGLRVRGDGWARVETEEWTETPFHLLRCRVLIPVE